MKRSSVISLAVLLASTAPVFAQNAPQSPDYAFDHGYPTAQTAQQARDDADFQRAMIAYRYFYPTVSVEGIFNGNRRLGIKDGDAISIMAASPRQVAFTANSDTPYGSGTIDLSSGPVVVELPPGPFIGLVDDHNQGWVLDMGLPGPDAGNGGKHLIAPLGYRGEIPSGYHVGYSPTIKNLIAVRSMPTNGDAQAALDALRKIRVYRLAEASDPHPASFIDISDMDMDATSLAWEDNLQFWSVLHDVLASEPTSPAMVPMYGLLAELGIERDKPFNPDPRLHAVLERAAKAARDQMLVSAFDSARPDRFNWSDRKWEWVGLVPDQANFETRDGVDLEARDRWFAQAIVASPAIFRRSAGADSLYWMAEHDGKGGWLDGGKTYKLTIPQPVPARLFWSVTAYDTATRSQVQTDQNKAALRSLFELKDASTSEPVELFFGPTAPAGQENRWIKTAPGKGWFAYMRIYGPEQAAFDKSWKPGDFEEVAPTVGSTK